ncbi:uncharacterized protein LOC143617447 [Bidens hawaiensis]|uniref:uncharacterized protein LOC143617447 n=1 Tax=Bidens hawaiensis TaxID=980011 RepID=UPI004049CEF9
MIYLISDSPSVSPTQVVPKKGGMTVVMNENNELIPSRTVTGQQFYCFLYGFWGYFQIPIAPKDQEKMTFTCPYGTFAYRRMPFGLCNTPDTFQHCMVAIFQDMIETSMEVFIDDFSVYGIVLGHKISRDGIEVDRAKIDTISTLPPPKNVKAIKSLLGHAGFYRRFIKNFSKITRPMTRLLEKDVPFAFDEECVKAFTFLKEMLRKFFQDVNRYVWDDPFLFKIGGGRILRRCVKKEEGWNILKHVHKGLTGGHHGVHATAQKVFDSGFYWPTFVKDSEEFVKLCDACQRTAIISDQGTHFCNAIMEKALARYGVTHRTSTAYHPQTNGQVENVNQGVKRILEKTVGLEHRAYWALKKVNVDLTAAARKRYFQIHELEELRDAAYSRSLNIKENTKALHDRRLKGGKEFKKGDKVLLFNSRLKLFAGKLRSKWTGPYLVKEVFPYGVVELENPDNGTSWKVNGHRLKHYLGGPEESIEMEETPLDPSH